MQFKKIKTNDKDSIIRLEFDGIKLPELSYDPLVYLDFNVKTYQPLHSGRSQEEWDKIFSYPTKFINTLDSESQSQLAMMFIYSNMMIRKKIEDEKQTLTADMDNKQREAVNISNQNLINILGSILSEVVASVDKKIDLYNKLLKWVYDGNVQVVVSDSIGSRPQDSVEKTFTLDDVKTLTAIAVLCKILTPIVGLFLDSITRLDINNAYKDIYGLIIFRDIINNRCSSIMDKLQNFTSGTVAEQMNSNTSRRLTNLWAGKPKSIYEDIAFSTILVRKLITVDLATSNSCLMTYIYSCVKGACSSKNATGKNGNVNVNPRDTIVDTSDSADSNLSTLEAGSFVSDTTADFPVLIEFAAQHLFDKYVADHPDYHTETIRLSYLKGNVYLGTNNTALLGMLFGRYLGGAKSIDSLRHTDLANLIAIAQLWCIENNFKDIVHLLSIVPTGRRKVTTTGNEQVNLNQWNRTPSYMNCCGEFQLELESPTSKLGWYTFLENLVEDLASKEFVYNTAIGIWDMLGEKVQNGEVYNPPASLSTSICDFVLYLCRNEKENDKIL